MLKQLPILLSLILVLTSSCGYFSDEPVENSDLYNNTSSLSGQCTLNPDEFGRLFDQDIQAQIKCVRDNFIQFNRYVRTNDPGSIGEDELRHFVSKFFAKNSDTIIKGLQILYEVNMLLLRDHPDRLSRGNIDPLYNLLLSINQQGMEVTQVLKKMTQADRHLHFKEQREKLDVALNQLAEKMLKVVEQRTGLPQSLNIKDFVLGLNDSFNVGNDRFDDELVDSLIFLKRLFVGGQKETITSNEIVDLIDLLPDLVLEAFDLIFSSPQMFSDQQEHYAFYQEKIVNISGLLHPIADDQVLFDEDDIYQIYEAIIGDEELLDLNEYRVIIQSVKRDLIGGHPKNYNFKDLQKTLLVVNLGIEGLSYFEKSKDLLKGLKVMKTQDLSPTRQSFLKQTQKLQDNFYLRVNELPYLPKDVKILNFFKTLNKEVPAMDYDIELIESLFAIKTLSVGGTKELLSKNEFFKAIDKLEDYAGVFFDFRYQLAVLPPGKQRSDFFAKQISEIEKIILDQDENTPILTQKDVYALIKALEEDPSKQSDLQNVYRSFKKNILHGDANADVSLAEFKKSLGYAKILNRSGAFIRDHREWFKKIDQAQSRQEYELLKIGYQQQLERFIRDIKKEVLSSNLIGDNEEIQFFNFVVDMAESLDIVDIDPQMIRDLLPLKKGVLGGESESLTKAELLDLSYKLPQIAPYLIDVYKYGVMDQDLSFFVKASKMLENILTSKNGDFFVMDMDKLVRLVKRFTDMPLEKFKSTFNKLHQKILGGHDGIITMDDIRNSVSMARDFAEQMYFNDVTYDAMKGYIEGTSGPIVSVPSLNIRAYDILRKEKVGKYKKLFRDSLKQHRYFTEQDSGLQRWGHPYKRNKFGFLQINTIKWAVIKLLDGWGHKDSTRPHHMAINLEEIETALNDFKPVLVEMGLWTVYPETFARNTLLLGDLFQNSSNGDMKLDVDELSEYGTMVLSAIDLSTDFLTNLVDHCTPTSGTSLEDYSFEDSCYREKLFPILFDELGYESYLPMLNKFVEDSKDDVDNADAPLNYIVNVEGFVRDTTTSDMPRREFILLHGAMINIETTFIRFDTNQNNQLDPDELDVAFEVYREAVISVADLSDGQRKYAKSIFLYMLEHMKIPTTWELMRYHYNPFAGKDVVAYRLNVGSLLYYLVRQG